ncbi:MAG: cytochrome c biogenesis CcdA family protein [Candidatus Woesearchaeota archaeon]
MEVSLFLAFAAGVLSFLSPCVLPIIPGYISYITGKQHKHVLAHTLLFSLGFLLVFALMGFIFSYWLSATSYEVRTWLAKIGGFIIILFGISMVSTHSFSWMHKHTHFGKQGSFVGSFVLGLSFALGWSPCVGAILGSILTLAIYNPPYTFSLLLLYGLGMCIPFIVLGLLFNQAKHIVTFIKPYSIWIQRIAGILLIVLGALILFDMLYIISRFWFVDWVI